MMTIFCFVLFLMQGTLIASLPESGDGSQNLVSVFKDLLAGSDKLSEEFQYQETDNEIPEDEDEIQDVSIPESISYKNQAFYAYVNGPRCYHTGSTIVFDKAPVNIGNRYSVHTGIFVVSVPGVYAFTWTVAAEDGNKFVTQLRVNGNVQDNIVTDSYSHWRGTGNHPATGFALANVKRGDHVFIRFISIRGCRVKSDSMTRSTFSGWLFH